MTPLVTLLLLLFHFSFVICGSLLICKQLRYRFMLPVILLTFFSSMCISLLWSYFGRPGFNAQDALWEPFELDYSANPWPFAIFSIAPFWLAPMYVASLVIRFAKKNR